MSALWIWGGAALAYVAFRLWYDGWRGPLRSDETEALLARLGPDAGSAGGPDTGGPDAEGPDADALDAVRAFVEADDGREFFMVNLLRFEPAPVAVGGAAPRAAGDVLQQYTSRFIPALMRRAGHPVFAARAAGGYVEAWGVEADPGWSLCGVIRYRSRRDMLELATHPSFAPAHVFKRAALAATFAFPAAPARGYVGPRLWVGLALALALAAALAQLAVRGLVH